jgi:predicted DNA-binding WGR domain protein
MNESEKPLKETLWFVGENYRGYGKKPVQSDKVYVVELYEDGMNAGSGTPRWSVKASWGRRGKAFQSQIKVQSVRYYNTALDEFEGLVRAKLDKGYKKWEFAPEVEEMHTLTGYDA